MDKKRILVVDDDNDILFLIAHSLKRLSPDLDISTAKNGASALEMLKSHPFELVLTDHMMPEVTGIMLAEFIQKHHPQTKVMLMTAYETSRLTSDPLLPHLDAVVPKPFQIRDVLAIVRQLLEDVSVPQRANNNAGLLADAVVALKSLWDESDVDVVLLLNADGRPVYSVGDMDVRARERLAAFVADNFLAVTELASLLGDNAETFQSSFHQSTRRNIYAHQIDGTYFLAVIFGAKQKPGPIWVYTRQTAETLNGMLDETL